MTAFACRRFPTVDQAKIAYLRVAERIIGRRDEPNAAEERRCTEELIRGKRVNNEIRDCLVAAGITAGGVVVGGVIGGAAARAIAGAVVGSSAASCLNALRG